jgi:hypothetical protein
LDAVNYKSTVTLLETVPRSGAVSMPDFNADQTAAGDPTLFRYIIMPLPEDDVREAVYLCRIINEAENSILPVIIHGAMVSVTSHMPLGEITVKHGEPQTVALQVKIVRKAWSRDEVDSALFSGKRLVQRYVILGELTYGADYRLFENYGLITFAPTGKYSVWNDDDSAPSRNEYWRIELTDLGRKYLLPKEKWSDRAVFASDVERVYPPWEGGERPDYGSERYRAEMNAIADRRDRMGRYYVDGELVHAGVLDCEAIGRDIASGELKPR